MCDGLPPVNRFAELLLVGFTIGEAPTAPTVATVYVGDTFSLFCVPVWEHKPNLAAVVEQVECV